jgi:putative FmdB family regulatory protein
VSGDTTKKVYLDSGYVVHASSSDLADSLGSYLRRSGRLTEEQFSRAMERRAGTSRRLGEVLIEQRMLAPAEVFQAIREHIEAIIWNLFSWQEGTVTFTIGSPDLTGHIRIQIPLRRVILEGVKRAANAKAIVQRMGGRQADPLRAVHGRPSLGGRFGTDPLRSLGARSAPQGGHGEPRSTPERRNQDQAPPRDLTMPIYEYECLACGKRSEVLQRASDQPLGECPECGGQVRKLISAPAFQFKGSGWYVTDYASKTSSSAAQGAEKGAEKATSGGASSDTAPTAGSAAKEAPKPASGGSSSGD